jgi:glycosyltransferase involved in cell wall biosynthesis
MSKAIASTDSHHAKTTATPIKVALVSCGLGHVHRGFEVSTARLFRALEHSAALKVRLFTGGRFDGSTPILNLPRDFLLNTILKPAVMVNKRRTWEFAYGIEQITFAFGLLADLIDWNPSIVWTKEAPFAHVLLALRQLLKLNFKIIFANGGGFKPATYEPFDHIQHLHQASYDDARNHGIAPSKMRVLPNVLPSLNTKLSREAARASFGYKSEEFVVISVAAWNRYHKRIDYLIDEMASLKDNRIKLLLCGHPEPDTPFLRALAQRKLGVRVQWHTLPDEDIPRALKASDVFVLASTNELFGSASIEAAMARLPVIAHPHGASQLLIDHGFQATDLSRKGNLARRLKEMRQHPPSRGELEKLASSIRSQFNDRALTASFVAMVQALA